ncbi:MAG: hypothetical protein UEP57_00980 [Oscillospiraceae bacterium]|nr:hypothetical protein [Oscillospiraceae bacterium]
MDSINCTLENEGFIKCLIPAEKKYPTECEEARQDSFRRILKFIAEW